MLLKGINVKRSILKHGETVTLKTASVTVDEYGDKSCSYSTQSLKALVRKISGKDLAYVESGARINVDCVFLFSPDVSVSFDDFINYDGYDFRVKTIKSIKEKDEVVGVEVFGERVQDG